MDAASAPARDAVLFLPSAFLAALLFLLTADLLFLPVAGARIKLGYFLVVAAWLFAPRAMFSVVRAALGRVPYRMWLPLAPLAVSVATSANLRDSVAWTLWLGFDLFTVATVYAFLKAHSFSGNQVRRCVAVALSAIMLGGMLQFVAIYGFGQLLFSPQSHFNLYRINGVSGWPHFLNIFTFLLLPIVLLPRRLRWPVQLMLALLAFVLVQSTAKTGWALLIALGLLLLALDRRAFVKRWLLFLLPITIVALLVLTPSSSRDTPLISGVEKVTRFSADLDLADVTTSGTDRVLINTMGLAVWWKHPWFGVGPRAYDDYVFSRFDLELPGVNKLDGNGQVNAKNENIWIELLAENGALFTLAVGLVLVRALWIAGWEFSNRLQLGAWIALVLYFCVSGQVSQTGLLTMVYAVFGIYFYSGDLTRTRPRGSGHAGPASMMRDNPTRIPE